MASSRTIRSIAGRKLAIGSGQIHHASTSQMPILASAQLINRPLRQPKEARGQRYHPPQLTRRFNTSAQLRAESGISTLDSVSLPSADFDPPPTDEDLYRVPILHDDYSTTTNFSPPMDDVVMKPEVSTASADTVFLPMADMSDGHGLNIDFHAMAERVAANLKNVKDVPAEEQASILKQIWSDLVDDMLGTAKKGKS